MQFDELFPCFDWLSTHGTLLLGLNYLLVTVPASQVAASTGKKLSGICVANHAFVLTLILLLFSRLKKIALSFCDFVVLRNLLLGFELQVLDSRTLWFYDLVLKLLENLLAFGDGFLVDVFLDFLKKILGYFLILDKLLCTLEESFDLWNDFLLSSVVDYQAFLDKLRQ